MLVSNSYGGFFVKYITTQSFGTSCCIVCGKHLLTVWSISCAFIRIANVKNESLLVQGFAQVGWHRF